jgi:hypothetical protein
VDTELPPEQHNVTIKLASPVTARAQFRAMGVDDSELIEVDVAGNVTGLQTGHSIGDLNRGNIVNNKKLDDVQQLQGMGTGTESDGQAMVKLYRQEQQKRKV